MISGKIDLLNKTEIVVVVVVVYTSLLLLFVVVYKHTSSSHQSNRYDIGVYRPKSAGMKFKDLEKERDVCVYCFVGNYRTKHAMIQVRLSGCDVPAASSRRAGS